MLAYSDKYYSTIFSALRHKVRREILQNLSTGEKSFTELCDITGISSSHLDYHLDTLDGLIKKSGSKYKLSESGMTSISIINQIETKSSPPKIEPSLNIVFKYTTLMLFILIVSTFSFYNSQYLMTSGNLNQAFSSALISTLIILYPITLVGFAREYWLEPYLQPLDKYNAWFFNS